jgi:mRNA-degrading endonuclease RelE of RelBE toxin-antitoxin system
MPDPHRLELSPAAKRDLRRLPLSIQKEEEDVITVTIIGTRENIYMRAKRRKT